MAQPLATMSDLDEARAVRYFLDALCDRDTIAPALENKVYPVAIFHSQQVCEKGAKGCLSLSGIVITRDHHVSDFFNEYVIPDAGDLKCRFGQSLVFLSRLESYYIPSRYGVDKAGRIHYLTYDPRNVLELSRAAGDFLDLCFDFFEIRTGKILPRSRESLEEFFLTTYTHCIRKLE